MHCAIHLLVDFSLRMARRAGLGTRFSAWPHRVQEGHHLFNEFEIDNICGHNLTGQVSTQLQ